MEAHVRAAENEGKLEYRRTEKIIALYARGMSTRDIQAHLRELYARRSTRGVRLGAVGARIPGDRSKLAAGAVDRVIKTSIQCFRHCQIM